MISAGAKSANVLATVSSPPRDAANVASSHKTQQRSRMEQPASTLHDQAGDEQEMNEEIHCNLADTDHDPGEYPWHNSMGEM